MLFLRPRWLLLAFTLAVLLVPAVARADVYMPGGFRLQSAALSVHERDGQAVIEVTRGLTLMPAQIRYGACACRPSQASTSRRSAAGSTSMPGSRVRRSLCRSSTMAFRGRRRP